MAFIPSPGVVRCAVDMTFGTVNVANVLNFIVPGAPDGPGVLTIASTLRGLWASQVMPNLSSAVTLRSVTATSLANDTAPSATSSGSGPVSGGVTGEPMPGGAAAVVTLYTAARGRTGRGRLFIGPLGETQVNTGNLTNATITAITNAVTAVRTGMNTSGYDLCVLSQYVNNAPRAAGVPRLVTTIVIRNPLVGYQSRRTGRK